MKVIVYSQKDKSEILELVGHIYAPPEKMKRAMQRLGMFWGMALLSVLIPVAHFILVPLFFLIGPFLSYKAYKEEGALEACDIICPECKKASTFDKNSGEWPLHQPCPQCMNRIYFDVVT